MLKEGNLVETITVASVWMLLFGHFMTLVLTEYICIRQWN